MMSKFFIRWVLIVLLFAFLLFVGIVCMVKVVYAQDAECVLVYDDNDDPGFYDEFNYTDGQGRDVCKVRVVFHQPAPGDPNGAVFTESGSINGYTAAFNGASVHVWRTGSPYSISHTRVWVYEVQPTDTPPPTETPPTEIPPSPTDTATLPPGVTATPTAPATAPPSGTPATPTLIPPVTNVPPTVPPLTTPPGPGTTPPSPHTTPVLPQTGEAGTAPLYGGIILFAIVIGFVFLKARKS